MAYPPATLGGSGWTVPPISVVRSIAFSAEIPLYGDDTTMGAHDVDGAIAFSVAAGAAVGSSSSVDLVADGVNTPTFAGMFPTNGSSDYLNVAGAINSITFYRASGVTWYSITNNAVVVSETYAAVIVPTGLTNVTDEGGGSYLGTSGATSNGGQMTFDRYLPANAAGRIMAKFPSGVNAAFTIGFDQSSNNALIWGNTDRMLQVTTAGQLKIGANGATTNVVGAIIAASATTWISVLRDTAGNYYAEYSLDDRATWVRIATIGAVDTGLKYVHAYVSYAASNGTRMVSPLGAGLVPA